MTLPRITADHFRESGMRGCNFQRLNEPLRPPGDWQALADLGANHARIWLLPQPDNEGTGYLMPEDQLKNLTLALRQLEALGMYAVVVMGLPDKHRQYGAWEEPKLLASATDIWAHTASRFKARRAIAAFDVVNEPVSPGADFKARQDLWAQGAQQMLDAITKADPTRVCIVEASPNALPEAITNVEPRKGVVYSLHNYVPFDLTNPPPAAAEKTSTSRAYSVADAQAMYASMRAVAIWQALHDVPVYVGELSCDRHVEGAAQWVTDAVALAHGYGFSWCYHEWRSWPGWDAEAVDTKTSYVRRADAPIATALRKAMERGA